MSKAKKSPKKIFPIVSKATTHIPSDADGEEPRLCPVCRSVDLSQSPERVRLLGGALVREDEDEDSWSAPSEKAKGLLTLTWDRSMRDPQCQYLQAVLEIALLVEGGYYYFDFCSTACLRTFLNSWVNGLEERVEAEKEDYRKWLRSEGRTDSELDD